MEEITRDYWKGISQGVCYILLATVAYTAQTAIVKWGATLGYIAPVMLIFRGIIQLICSLIESILQLDKYSTTKRKCKCNIWRIVKDIRTIGIVPRRTRIPLFDDSSARFNSRSDLFVDMSVSLLSNNSHSPRPPLTPATNNINNSDHSCSDFPNIEPLKPLTPTTKSIKVIDKALTPKTPRTERLNTPTPRQRKPRTKNYRVLIWTAIILRGAFGGIATWAQYEASILLPVGDIQSLVALSATITPVLAFIVFRDTLSKLQVFSLLAAVCSVLLIVQPPFIFNKDAVMDKHIMTGYIYALITASFASFCYITIQFARKVPVYMLTVSQSIGSILTGTVVLLCNNQLTSSDILWIDYPFDVGYLLIMGLTGYTFLWLLQTSGSHLESAIIAMLLNLSIFWGYIAQIAFFHQVPGLVTMIGAVCMFLSAVIVSVNKISDARKKSMSVIDRDVITTIGV